MKKIHTAVLLLISAATLEMETFSQVSVDSFNNRNAFFANRFQAKKEQKEPEEIVLEIEEVDNEDIEEELEPLVSLAKDDIITNIV